MNRLESNYKISKETKVLGLLTLFCFALLIGRIYVVESTRFTFLVWNLFLAGLPYLFSRLLSKNLFGNGILLFLWLLFLPNSPYIITDLVHITSSRGNLIWIDLVLISAFAITGLLYGFFSLKSVEDFLQKQNLKVGILFSVGIWFLCGFGVYLGRVLRWNSWDIINRPEVLLADILDRIINPFEHPLTWEMTILFGLFTSLLYWLFKFTFESERNFNFNKNASV